MKHGSYTMRAYTSVHTRFATNSDISAMTRIESASFPYSWTAADFKSVLNKKNSVRFVAEHDNCIIGYVIAESLDGYLHVLNLAVEPEFRRCGVGTQLVQRLVEKLSLSRTRISLEIREGNLPAQCFFRSLEFRCTKTQSKFYDDCAEDALLFEYRVDWTPDGYEVLRSIMQGNGKVVK